MQVWSCSYPKVHFAMYSAAQWFPPVSPPKTRNHHLLLPLRVLPDADQQCSSITAEELQFSSLRLLFFFFFLHGTFWQCNFISKTFNVQMNASVIKWQHKFYCLLSEFLLITFWMAKQQSNSISGSLRFYLFFAFFPLDIWSTAC